MLFIRKVTFSEFFFWTTLKARVTENTYMWVSLKWKTKSWSWKIYTSHTHWVPRGTGTPKDRDEVNRREFWVCDGWVCDLADIVVPSIFKLIRSAAALVRMFLTSDFFLLWTTDKVLKFSVGSLLSRMCSPCALTSNSMFVEYVFAFPHSRNRCLVKTSKHHTAWTPEIDTS